MVWVMYVCIYVYIYIYVDADIVSFPSVPVFCAIKNSNADSILVKPVLSGFVFSNRSGP